MRYRPARAGAAPVTVSDTELWQRLEHFLREIVPVAEEAGIRLAAHPDDPVANELRHRAAGEPPRKYDRLLDIVDSPQQPPLRLCLARCRKCRSVRSIPCPPLCRARPHRLYPFPQRPRQGPAISRDPSWTEGDIDGRNRPHPARRKLRRRADPPTTHPEMSCAAPWHAGMAWPLRLEGASKSADQQPVIQQGLLGRLTPEIPTLEHSDDRT